jgi:hypothetical protein
VIVKRRSLLFALAGAGAVSLAGWRLLCGSDEEAVAAIVFKRLGYLKLDEAGVRQFARDYAARHLISEAKLRMVAAAGALYKQVPISGASFLTSGIRHGEDRIVTKYLLSTDFFQSGADESQTVQYLGFFDPRNGCGNPFARPVMQAGPELQWSTT